MPKNAENGKYVAKVRLQHLSSYSEEHERVSQCTFYVSNVENKIGEYDDGITGSIGITGQSKGSQDSAEPPPKSGVGGLFPNFPASILSLVLLISPLFIIPLPIGTSINELAMTMDFRALDFWMETGLTWYLPPLNVRSPLKKFLLSFLTIFLSKIADIFSSSFNLPNIAFIVGRTNNSNVTILDTG